MRVLCTLGMLAATVPLSGPAHAACDGTGDDREVVGYVPDVVLTAGVPETRTIEHWHVVYPGVPLAPNGYLPFYECGAIARSTLPGLSIRSTYFDFGVVHGAGEWAGLNGSHGAEGLPRLLGPIGLELVFDGTAPAGAVGAIEIAQNIGGDGIGYIPRRIALVNVYVVAPGAPPPRTWFTVTADAGSVSGSRLVLDHPLLNGAPGRPVLVTHARAPGGPGWPHPVSVSYDTSLSRWTINNDDGVAMPPGIAFHVRIDPSATVLRPSRGLLPLSRLRVDDPRANYNPFATIFVTPVSANPHPIAVRYVRPYWYIVNADGATIGRRQRFHVQVLGATAYRDDRFRGTRPFDPLGTNALSNGAGIDAHGIGADRTAGDSRFVDFFWARGMPRPIILTPNQTPYGRDPINVAGYVDVWFAGTLVPLRRVAIARADGSPMPNAASFNVWGPPSSGADVHDPDLPPVAPPVP